MEKLGGTNSEAFVAWSIFETWNIDGNGVLNKEELIEGLSPWKRDTNSAINALARRLGKNYGSH